MDTARASACFDLQHNTVTVMEGVYFVRYFCPSVAAEKDRAPDAIGCFLTGFHIKPELAETSSQLLKNPIASKSGLTFYGGDAFLRRTDVSDERFHPSRRPSVPREVVPRWVRLGPHPAILPRQGRMQQRRVYGAVW
jgi:hypothetical protein